MTLHSRCQSHFPSRDYLEAGFANWFISIARYGGARRDRTDDLMLAKHALYQLSYGPIIRSPNQESVKVAVRASHVTARNPKQRLERVVGPGRLELPTSRLSGVRSNQAELRAYSSPLGSRSRRQTLSAGGDWKEKRRRRRPAYF